jgi:hypothetical protein
MPLSNLGPEIDHTLSALEGDVATFTHAGGQAFKVRLQPRFVPNVGYALFEDWHRDPTPGNRWRRLLTERGYEIVFALPLLLQRNLERHKWDVDALMQAFFEEMRSETFKNYPRELFQ